MPPIDVMALRRQQARPQPRSGRRHPSPRPPASSTGLKNLLAQGSQILARLVHIDPGLVDVSRPTWTAMSVAYQSHSQADAITALTQLQIDLQRWTAEDADVASDAPTQAYRRLVHSVLDHGVMSP